MLKGLWAFCLQPFFSLDITYTIYPSAVYQGVEYPRIDDLALIHTVAHIFSDRAQNRLLRCTEATGILLEL